MSYRTFIPLSAWITCHNSILEKALDFNKPFTLLRAQFLKHTDTSYKFFIRFYLVRFYGLKIGFSKC